MKTLITIAVALIMGITIFGCGRQFQSTAQDPFVVASTAGQDTNTAGEPTENLPPDEYQSKEGLLAISETIRQEDFPYDEVFTYYVNADRDSIQERFGVPDMTYKANGILHWEWCLTIDLPNKKSPKVNVKMRFKTNDELKRVERIEVEFLPELLGGKYVPLGSNISSLVSRLKRGEIYGRTSKNIGGLEEFYIFGSLGGDNEVLIKGWSSVWGFVTEESVDEEGLRQVDLKTNPGFDWRVGQIHTLILGAQTCEISASKQVEAGLKSGDLRLVKQL